MDKYIQSVIFDTSKIECDIYESRQHSTINPSLSGVFNTYNAQAFGTSKITCDICESS